MRAFLICSPTYHVLFAKFWAPTSDAEVALWQQRLFTALSGALEPGDGEGESEALVELDDAFVVARVAGGLVFALSGSPHVAGAGAGSSAGARAGAGADAGAGATGEDEILVADTLRLIIDMLGEHLRRVTDEGVVAQHDKVVLVLDAIVADGAVDAYEKADVVRSLALA